MMPSEVSSKLNENERKLLLALKLSGSARTSDLSQSMGLNKDAVEKASSWAETKGVVKNKKNVIKNNRMRIFILEHLLLGLSRL